MTGSQQALSDLRERRRCPLRRLLDNLGRGGSRQPRGVSAASAPKAHGGFAALPQGNATTESPRSPPAPEEHPAEGAQIGNATTESPRGAAPEEHPAEDVDVASAAVDAGVMPATVHADGAKATEPGAPSEVSADDATVNAAPPETIPDTSNAGRVSPESQKSNDLPLGGSSEQRTPADTRVPGVPAVTPTMNPEAEEPSRDAPPLRYARECCAPSRFASVSLTRLQGHGTTPVTVEHQNASSEVPAPDAPGVSAPAPGVNAPDVPAPVPHETRRQRRKRERRERREWRGASERAAEDASGERMAADEA